MKKAFFYLLKASASESHPKKTSLKVSIAARKGTKAFSATLAVS